MTTLPQSIYTIEQIRQLEQLAQTQLGYSAEVLMQRAGAVIVEVLRKQWPNAQHIAVMCGKGNNGGDGYVAALLAHLQGLHVTLWQVGEQQPLSSPAFAARQACLQAGMQCQIWQPNAQIKADVIIDAVLGIGLQQAPTGSWRQVIAAMNAAQRPILAIDIPSGLQADTGRVQDIAVQARVTVTFIGLKPGLLTGAGPAYTGKLICHDLELPIVLYQQVEARAQTLALKKEYFQPRERTAHKGQFGHVLVIGGDYGMAGAVRLAGEAAARVGVGLVTVVTRPEHVAAINSARPELLCYGLAAGKDLEPLLERATLIIIGPGLGQGPWGQALFAQVLATTKPLVVDADALNLLAKQTHVKPNWILTPHPGEAARLLNCTIAAVQDDRLQAAKALQQRYGSSVILKGAGTVVQSDQQLPAICTAGNPGMASGGMGDVLSGIIGGLAAQGLPLAAAAEQGVIIHALAADQAAQAGERGMLALDVIAQLRTIVPNK